MKPGDERITFETIASGQEAAYADTVFKGRITFEHVPYGNPAPTELQPWEPSIDLVRRYCKFFSGWVEVGEGDPFSTRLEGITPVADKPGVWEWRTRARYND